MSFTHGTVIKCLVCLVLSGHLGVANSGGNKSFGGSGHRGYEWEEVEDQLKFVKPEDLRRGICNPREALQKLLEEVPTLAKRFSIANAVSKFQKLAPEGVGWKDIEDFLSWWKD
ncbi:unnamed protein product [Cladocopium goreaui]|uniref:Uncharacterized protein n=1 Tax=Cladocopium goreaui TaxID=2562237 RepID=A0A9P1GDR8_9DINO|nr:unnamed protein product [Cladocopium goreaui]